jgi:hypothetical protein
MDRKLFAESVIDNFRYLQDSYGFSAPVIEDFGREIYVNYDRDNQTVSISYEFLSYPIIEISCPITETGEPPVPWISKGEIQRSRRISKAILASRFSFDENTIARYMPELALAFDKTELNWLMSRTIS